MNVNDQKMKYFIGFGLEDPGSTCPPRVIGVWKKGNTAFQMSMMMTMMMTMTLDNDSAAFANPPRARCGAFVGPWMRAARRPSSRGDCFFFS